MIALETVPIKFENYHFALRSVIEFSGVDIFTSKFNQIENPDNLIASKILETNYTEVVRFIILAFCLTKSLEHIEHIFLVCENIFCTTLETWLKKIGQIFHQVLISVLTPSIIGCCNLGNYHIAFCANLGRLVAD